MPARSSSIAFSIFSSIVIQSWTIGVVPWVYISNSVARSHTCSNDIDMNATCIRRTYDRMMERNSELYSLGSAAASSESSILSAMSSNKANSTASSGSSGPRSNTNSLNSAINSAADPYCC